MGVEFIYVYKALAHPELNGYVQPFTLEERLMHVKEAQRTLGSGFTWICDGMDNAVKEAFGNRANSEFVIDPAGTIVRARPWSDPETLRKDLETLVGPVDAPTRISDLDMQTAEPPREAPSGIVPRVDRPSGGQPLLVEPEIVEDGEPFYVKLRGEAAGDLLRSGRGQLYLGFHLDPLYRVHWNNLVEPIRVEIEPSSGVEVSETSLRGPKVEKPTDIDPREFLIDVAGARSGATLRVTVQYFACNDDEGWCKPVTQHYTLRLEPDPHGGRVRGAGRGDRDRDGRGRNDATDDERLRRGFERMDLDGDGRVTAEEVPERMRGRFDRMDANGDGVVTLEEMMQSRSRRGGGRGRT